MSDQSYVTSSLKSFKSLSCSRTQHGSNGYHPKTSGSGFQRSITKPIMKTCPCNVYPLKPHFYIEKLGFAGVYLFFLFLLQNIDCGYSLEPPRRGGSNEYPQSMFWSKNKKNIKFFPVKIFIFKTKKISVYYMDVFS